MAKSYKQWESTTPRFLDHYSEVEDSTFFKFNELKGVVAYSQGVKPVPLEQSGYNPNYKEI